MMIASRHTELFLSLPTDKLCLRLQKFAQIFNFSILNHIFAKSNTFEKEIKHNPQRHLKESKPISIIYLCKVDLVSSQPSPPVYLYSKMNNFPGYLSSKA